MAQDPEAVELNKPVTTEAKSSERCIVTKLKTVQRERGTVTDDCEPPDREIMSACCAEDDEYLISKTRHIKITRLPRKQVSNTSDGKVVRRAGSEARRE